jgi:hypothetical protein
LIDMTIIDPRLTRAAKDAALLVVARARPDLPHSAHENLAQRRLEIESRGGERSLRRFVEGELERQEIARHEQRIAAAEPKLLAHEVFRRAHAAAHAARPNLRAEIRAQVDALLAAPARSTGSTRSTTSSSSRASAPARSGLTTYQRALREIAREGLTVSAPDFWQRVEARADELARKETIR